MEQITKDIFAETKTRGCNSSIVFTEAGSVFIDTAQLVTPLLAMRKFALERGPIRAVINTEPHIDHIFGNHWFYGECPVIGHRLMESRFMNGHVPDYYAFSRAIIEKDDPEGLAFMPAREEYIKNKPQITYDTQMSFELGGKQFVLYYVPGHSIANTCVYLPEEKILFAGDLIFSHCQTFLHTAHPGKLLESLDFIRTLDIDRIVPGHGPVVDKSYIDVQRAFVYEWISAVANGIAKGWSKEECQENISFADRYPTDIGLAHEMEYIQHTNVDRLYDYLTGVPFKY